MKVRHTLSAAFLIIAIIPDLAGQHDEVLERLRYNNENLVVDLGVGLWANPIPMDYDSDGDWDLVVSCADTPYKGTYFFENTSGTSIWPVFKKGIRIGTGFQNTQVSFVKGDPHVLSPGYEYLDFIKNQYENPLDLDLDGHIKSDIASMINIKNEGTKAHLGNIRANQWKYCDYDGDQIIDLIIGIGDWNDYGMEWDKSGWENGYDHSGKWLNGPLHGYVFYLRNTGTNQSPEYAQPIKLLAKGRPIDVFGMPSPNFADFDNDGDLDLICGEFLDKLTYFRNVGTRKKPEYEAGKVINIGRKPLKMDLCMIVPVAVDFDKDGDMDLVVGQEDGRVAFVEHTGRVLEGMPVFRDPRFFEQEANYLKFGALATPFTYDWDADGDEDIICGNTAGYIGFIENLGGGENPVWAEPEYLQAGGEIIHIQAGYNGIVQGPSEAKWGYTVLTVGDWNEDGLPDLVVNSSWGKVIWFQNVGQTGFPVLLPAQSVEVNWLGSPPKPEWTWWEPSELELVTQWRTTPQVIDLNRDGLLDLVMLDPEGFLAFYEKRMYDEKPILLPPKRVFYVDENSVYDRRHEILDSSGGLLRLNGDRAGKSGRRKFLLTDWDGDKDIDLMVNSAQNVNLLENIGQRGDTLIFKDKGPMCEEDLAGHTTSPAIVDWNKDGRNDLLIGAEDGHFYYLRNKK